VVVDAMQPIVALPVHALRLVGNRCYVLICAQAGEPARRKLIEVSADLFPFGRFLLFPVLFVVHPLRISR
jgi:hypothetical protein